MAENDSILAQIAANPEKFVGALNKTTEAIKAETVELERHVKANKAFTDSWATANPILASVTKSLRTTRSEMRQTDDALNEIVESLDEIRDRDDVLANMFNSKDSKDTVTNLKDVEDELASLSKKLESGLELTANDLFKVKELKKFKNRVKEATDNVGAARKKIEKAFGSGKGFGELKDQFMGARKSPRKMQEFATALKGSGVIEKTLGKGMLGKAAGGVVGKVAAGGAAAKVIPYGGTVISVASTLNKVVTNLDDYRKKANQDYAGLAGPQMNGAQFKGKSEKYNKSIRNTDFNIEMGMGSEDWNAMFQSMKGAGVGVDQLSKSLGSQKDVMRSVRETGVALGMSTDVMGEAYTTMSLETKSGLQTIQDGFEDVARGAQRAGISTDKFYSTIQASILAMGSYGNYTSIAASALDKLSNTAGISFQDASEAANKSTTGFKDMSSDDKLKYVGILDATKGGFQALTDAFDKALTETNEKLKESGLTDKERFDLGAKKYRLEQVKGSKDPLARAQALEDASGSKAGLDLVGIMGNVGGNAKRLIESMNSGEYARYAGQIGMGQDVADQYSRSIRGNMSQLGGVSSLNTAIQTDPKIAGKLSAVLDVMGKGELMTPEDNSYVEAQLTEIAKAAGMSEDQLRGLLATGKRTPKAFAKAMRPGLESGQISPEEIAVGSASAIQDATDRWNKDQVKGQTDIIKELTPMEKMLGITRDSIYYNMSIDKAAVATAKTLTDIKGKIYKMAAKYLGSDDSEDPEATQAAIDEANVRAATIAASGAGAEAVNAVSGMSNQQMQADYKAGGATTKLAKSMGITNSEDFAKASAGKSGKEFSDSYVSGQQAKVNEAAGADKMIALDAQQTEQLNEALFNAYMDGDQQTFNALFKQLTASGVNPKDIESALTKRKVNQYGKTMAKTTAITAGVAGFAGGVAGGIFGLGVGAVPGAIGGAQVGTLAGAGIGAMSSWYSDDSDDIKLPEYHGGGDVPALLQSGESVVTPEHKSNFMKFMDGLGTSRASGMGSSSRTLSVGTMNITQPTDTNGIMNMFKRQEFNSMAN